MFDNICRPAFDLQSIFRWAAFTISSIATVFGIIVNSIYAKYKSCKDSTVWHRACMVTSTLVPLSGLAFEYFTWQYNLSELSSAMYLINLNTAIAAVTVWLNVVIIISLKAKWVKPDTVKLISALGAACMSVVAIIENILHLLHMDRAHTCMQLFITSYCLIILLYSIVDSRKILRRSKSITLSSRQKKRKKRGFEIMIWIFLVIVVLGTAAIVVSLIYPCIYFYTWSIIILPRYTMLLSRIVKYIPKN